MLTERMKIQAITNLVAGQDAQIDIDCEAFDGRLGNVYRILAQTNKDSRHVVLDSLCQLDSSLEVVVGQVLNERPGAGLSFENERIDELDGHKLQVEYLWQHWIPRSEMSMIVADPGVGKTLFVLDLARRMLNGLEMPDGTPAHRKQQSILYIDAEDYVKGIYRRVKVWQQAGHWEAKNAGFYLMPYPTADVLDFSKAIHRDALVERVNAIKPDWVILDSLSSGLINYTFDNDVIETLVFFKRLMREFDLAFTLLHHNNKAARNRQSNDIANLSGAGLFGRRSRVLIGMNYHPENGAEINKQTDPRLVQCIKTNDVWPDNLHFKLQKLEPAGVMLDYYKPDTSLDASHSTSIVEQIREAIDKLGDKATAKNIATELGYSHSWMREVLMRGERQGLLKKQGHGKAYCVVE